MILWTVVFYQDGKPIAEVDIPEAPTMIHAIVYAANKRPEALDASDYVDAVEIPDNNNNRKADV
jgi:hypothetical protein